MIFSSIKTLNLHYKTLKAHLLLLRQQGVPEEKRAKDERESYESGSR